MTLGVASLRPHLVIGTFLGFLTHKRLISQSFSAFCASSLKNVSAVSSSHSFSEAVLFFSLSFFRLICSEHYCHLLGNMFGSVLLFQPYLRFYTMTSYIINTKGGICQVFFKFFWCFSSIYLCFNMFFVAFSPFKSERGIHDRTSSAINWDL